MENREIWLKVRVTDKERRILKRKAKKVGLTVSDFVRSSLIHSDNLTINVIDTSVLGKTLFELKDVRSVATNAVKPHLNHPSILLSDGFRSLPERGFSTDTQVPKDRHQTTVLQLAKRRLFAIPELGNGGGTVLQVLIHESEDK